jgi:hypothetical protein
MAGIYEGRAMILEIDEETSNIIKPDREETIEDIIRIQG